MKSGFILLSLLAPKKVTKKRHPFTGPVKRDSLAMFFIAVGVTNSSRIVGTQTCAALIHNKNHNFGTVKMGPWFQRSLCDQIKTDKSRGG
jgi:hypothetical protein